MNRKAQDCTSTASRQQVSVIQTVIQETAPPDTEIHPNIE